MSAGHRYSLFNRAYIHYTTYIHTHIRAYTCIHECMHAMGSLVYRVSFSVDINHTFDILHTRLSRFTSHNMVLHSATITTSPCIWCYCEKVSTRRHYLNRSSPVQCSFRQQICVQCTLMIAFHPLFRRRYTVPSMTFPHRRAKPGSRSNCVYCDCSRPNCSSRIRQPHILASTGRAKRLVW